MTLDITLLIGVLFGVGTYLLLQGEWTRFLYGSILLSNAVNVLLLSMSGNPHGKSVPIVNGELIPAVDPLPQALILTAIVIGFGLTSYLIVYLYQLYRQTDTTDIETLFSQHSREE